MVGSLLRMELKYVSIKRRTAVELAAVYHRNQDIIREKNQDESTERPYPRYSSYIYIVAMPKDKL